MNDVQFKAIQATINDLRAEVEKLQAERGKTRCLKNVHACPSRWQGVVRYELGRGGYNYYDEFFCAKCGSQREVQATARGAG